MHNLADWGNLATIILAVFAIIAAFLAWRNLVVLRAQLKNNTFLSILRELSEIHARENRKIIYENFPYSKNVSNIQEVILRDEINAKIYKDAIEETVSLLDRAGFFLLHGDPNLKKDAPEWIWTITAQTWEKIEWYVEYRKTRHKGYAKYYKELYKEAKKRGYSEIKNKDMNKKIEGEPNVPTTE